MDNGHVSVTAHIGALPKTPRLDSVDALRGFAVMAILLLHNVEHFLFPVYPTDVPAWLGVLDKGTTNAMFALFGGKAYAIFALLFGLTFHIQYSNQLGKGKDFGRRFLWRLLWLAGFATLNAAFFPGGDVLMLYAVLGVVFFVVRKLSNKAILAIAVLFFLQPVEWFHYAMSLCDSAYALPNYGVDEAYRKVGEACKSGNFFEFLRTNITLGQQASFMWAVSVGRASQTVGLLLIGLYLGRTQRFVANEETARFWLKVLVVCAVLFSPLYSLKEQIMTTGAPITQQTAGAAFDMWQKLAFTFVLIASFVLFYRSEKFRNCVSVLRDYGKMSLTNYVSQSVLGMLVYFPFGLSLAPYCGTALSLIIGFGMAFLQVWFCKWWLARFSKGPLEALWHRLTWFAVFK